MWVKFVYEIRGVLVSMTCMFTLSGVEPEFPTSYVVVFFMFNELRWDVIVHFVDIGGIVHHHCLNFLFIESLLKPHNKIGICCCSAKPWPAGSESG